MSDPLRIAVVCPLPWPPTDEVTLRVAHEADALARRGHRVTVMAPGHDPGATHTDRDAMDHGDVLAAPGRVRVLLVGRAIRTTARRRMAGPIDLAAGLERALGAAAFDVVHVHEPLTPTPLLAALRHTDARTVATFHRVDPPTSVAFMGSLVERAIERLDARIAASPAVARTLAQVLPGSYSVIPAGSDATTSGATPPTGGVMIVARGKDRAGLRFGLAVARGIGAGDVAPLTVLGPREAAWRTRTAVPKALRDVVHVLPDDDPDAWMRAIDDARIVLTVTADDLAGTVVTEARARGRVVIAPDVDDSRALVSGGADGVLAAPFSSTAWTDALAGLLGDPGKVAALGAEAARRSAPHTWDAVAAQLEETYRNALQRPPRRGAGVVLVDPRLRPSPMANREAMAAVCREMGLDVVAVATPGGLAASRAFAEAAPEGLRVVDGREITTTDGAVVGLFLTDDVPDGLPLGETLEAIHRQGGVTMIPHPASVAIPPAEALRAVAHLIDCRELATGAMGTPGIAAVRDARAMGLTVTSGSAAVDLAAVGSAGMMMPSFQTGREFVSALADAEALVPRRGRRARARRRRARST